MILLLLTIMIPATQAAFAADNDDISGRVCSEYFRARSVNYYEAQKLFGNDYAPVAAYIASRAGVSPEQVNRVYLNSGSNWSRVILHFNIAPSSFFLPVPTNYKVGPPYGKAYGYWKKSRSNPQNKIVLNSNDIYNLVHLNIIHDYYGTPVKDIINYRSKGNSFKWIIKNQQANKYKAKVQKKEHNQGKGKDKNKGNGKGQGKNKDKE